MGDLLGQTGDAGQQQGDAGSQASVNWKDSILSGIADTEAKDQASKTLGRFEVEGELDSGKLGKSYLELTKYQGNSVGLPDASDAESMKKFADRVTSVLGKPETADEYQINLPEGISEDQVPSEERLGSFRSKAHELGLTQGQLEGMFGWFMNEQGTDIAELQQEQTKAREELEKDWGKDFDKNKALALRTLQVALKDKPELFEGIKDTLDPFALKVFHKLSGHFTEDTLKLPDGGLRNTAAQQKIKELNEAAAKDPTHPLVDRNSPRHAAAVRERDELYKQAFPSEDDTDSVVLRIPTSQI